MPSVEQVRVWCFNTCLMFGSTFTTAGAVADLFADGIARERASAAVPEGPQQ